MLAAGSIGEELLFRGYGFQVLVARHRHRGPRYCPLGSPFRRRCTTRQPRRHSAEFGAITAGFGILFGYAYLRSRDLWLPIGLHFGWNFTLPALWCQHERA